MKGLADAGHDVTVITPNLDLELPKNGTYTTVHLTGFYEIYQGKARAIFITNHFHNVSITFRKILFNFNKVKFFLIGIFTRW